MTFETVGREEFVAALDECGSSPFFNEQVARFDLGLDKPLEGASYLIHRGPVRRNGIFDIPGVYTLILGDVHVDGLIDASDGSDLDGGLFVVGNVTCKAFSGDFGKCIVIDGNLSAQDILLNAYNDSSLVVVGDLRTDYFFGLDIWAEVGGLVRIRAGQGYCLPIDYSNPAQEAIYPDLDRDDSLDLLLPIVRDELRETPWPIPLRKRLRSGEPLFR